MKKFEYVLTRDKQHYLDKMNELDREYAKRENIIGKNYIRGVHFKPQGEKVFGYYSIVCFVHGGALLVPFRGSFVRDGDGSLRFRGCTYPDILTSVLLLVFLILSIFPAQRVDIVILSLFIIFIYCLIFLKYSKILLADLEEFFV